MNISEIVIGNLYYFTKYPWRILYHAKSIAIGYTYSLIEFQKEAFMLLLSEDDLSSANITHIKIIFKNNIGWIAINKNESEIELWKG